MTGERSITPPDKNEIKTASESTACPEDDWSGITSPSKRRTVQNRLAQRAWRHRQARLANEASQRSSPSEGATFSNDAAERHPRRKELKFVIINFKAAEENKNQTASSARSSPRPCGTITIPLSPDNYLLPVAQNNVYRALLCNIGILGITYSSISQDESQSNFAILPQSYVLSPLPPALQPTVLQLTTYHHPWIDLLPCPKLRDNILCQLPGMGEEEETELCEDMVGVGKLQVAGKGPGLLVWGDPYSLESWEVTEALREKWSFVFEDCEALLNVSSNWRVFRDEFQFEPQL